MIPPTQGASLGSQHNMRNKRFLNFLTDGDLLRLNRDGLAQSGMAVADVTAREIGSDRRRDLGREHRARRRRRQGDALQLPGRPDLRRRAPARHHGHRQVQQLHDGGRAADRLGLLHPGPRRPDLQDEDHRRRPAAPRAASCGSSTRTRRTSTRSTSSTPTARRRWRRSATSARRTTRRSTPASAPAPPTSTRTPPTACTSTSSTSAPTRRASCTTRSA